MSDTREVKMSAAFGALYGASPDILKHRLKLRPYQQEVVDALRKVTATATGRITSMNPTFSGRPRSGKSELIGRHIPPNAKPFQSEGIQMYAWQTKDQNNATDLFLRKTALYYNVQYALMNWN